MKPLHILTLMLVLFSVYAWADTAYIPPDKPQVAITRAADGQQIDARRIQSSSGLSFSYEGGRPTISTPNRPQFGEVRTPTGTITVNSAGVAVKTNPVTMTGTYGEKATGSVRTQTTLPSNSSLSRGFGAMAVGAMATAHHQSLQSQGVAEQISRGFADGDWGAVAAGIGKAMDWSGIGGIYAQALYGNPAVQQEVMAPMQQQTIDAARQQYEAYRQAAAADPANYQQYVYISIETNHPNNSNRAVQSAVLKVSDKPVSGSRGWFNNRDHGQSFTVNILGADFSYEFPQGNSFVLFNFRPATMQDIIEAKVGLVPPEIAYPTQAQWAAAMEAFLNSSHATNEAIRDLANALWASGGLNPQNTQTAVIGSPSDNTFLSAPYTPSGAQTAQQTQFFVHPDGRVTTGIVSRPDLGAHSSQAPTRSPLGGRKRPDVDIDIDAGSGSDDAQKPQEVEICEEDDEAKLVCIQAGSDDYEDLELSKNEISLEFERKEYFDDGGSCPANPQFQFLAHSYTFDYKPICNIAQWVAPMVELAGIVTAAGIAYAAVREL